MLSRVADHLYWMGRYLERAEGLTRLLRTHFDLLLDVPKEEGARRFFGQLESLHGDKLENVDPHVVQEATIFDIADDASVVRCIAAARGNARQVRDHIPTELWEQLNQLHLWLSRGDARNVWKGYQPEELFRKTIDGLRLAHGYADACMERDEGWHFWVVGRYIERGITRATLLEDHLEEMDARPSTALEGERYLDWVTLLRCANADEAYRRVHTAYLRPDRILRFLILDRNFPQSIHFAVVRISEALRVIGSGKNVDGSGARRAVTELSDRLVREARRRQEQPLPAGLLQEVRLTLLQVHEACHDLYIAYPIDRMFAH